MSYRCYINGKFVEREQATVSVFDHGFLYGDGVFEGIRSYSGRVFRLDAHIDRLYKSAKAIDLAIPLSSKEMTEATLESLRINELLEAYIRLVVTRGSGDLGLNPRKVHTPPTIVIVPDKLALYPKERYENGLEVCIVSVRRIPPDSLSPAIKSLNYLNNILAVIEVNQRGLHEGILLNQQGYVAEATADNIFVIKDGRISTPHINAGALPGITRGAVLDICRTIGIPVREDWLTAYDLYTADEMFLTGTGAELIPVVKVDGRMIGGGKPGPVFQQLNLEFRQLVQVDGTPIYSNSQKVPVESKQ